MKVKVYPNWHQWIQGDVKAAIDHAVDMLHLYGIDFGATIEDISSSSAILIMDASVADTFKRQLSGKFA